MHCDVACTDTAVTGKCPTRVALQQPFKNAAWCVQDPGARRHAWNAIMGARTAAAAVQHGRGATCGGRQGGLAMVLTTHSMDECEALCSRVGIMHQVSSALTCLRLCAPAIAVQPVGLGQLPTVLTPGTFTR